MSELHQLERVTGPAALPITLAEVKAQSGIEHSDDDVRINRLIAVGVGTVDATGVLGQAMISQTWALWMSATPLYEVALPLGPVQSVSAVKYYDTDGTLQTDDLANYNIFGRPMSKTIKPKTGFAWPVAQQRSDAIKIEFVAGFGDAASDVPEGLRHAMIMLIAFYNENRENELIGVTSKTLPFGFADLLNLHRESWYG